MSQIRSLPIFKVLYVPNPLHSPKTRKNARLGSISFCALHILQSSTPSAPPHRDHNSHGRGGHIIRPSQGEPSARCHDRTPIKVDHGQANGTCFRGTDISTPSGIKHTGMQAMPKGCLRVSQDGQRENHPERRTRQTGRAQSWKGGGTVPRFRTACRRLTRRPDLPESPGARHRGRQQARLP
jgi:hypothetical protein